MKVFGVAALAALLAGGVCGDPTSPTLPTVDLGYEIYRANSLNDTTKLYSFSNVRYAAPPTGTNRFKAPQPPVQNRSLIQFDRPEAVCPQGIMGKMIDSDDAREKPQEAIHEELANYTARGQRSFERPDYLSANLSAAEIDLDSFDPSAHGPRAEIDPKATEDCLFLDVIVPQHIFERNTKSGRGAAVMVFVHGGSLLIGSKSMFGDPSALVSRSQEGDNEGVIYVALNYRLGAFGWLSGPTFQMDGKANAGLHDQLFALAWVQEHISKFGGDPTRVTLFGQSSGGDSIMGHLTAYGGTWERPLFSQALLHSPGVLPVATRGQQEDTLQVYLRLLNVSNIAEARELPTEKLQLANIISSMFQTRGSRYGLARDDDVLPRLPSQLLAEGRFHRDVKIMTSFTESEGTSWIDFYLKNGYDIQELTSNHFPFLDQDQLNYITDTLYPPVFDGNQANGYTNELERFGALVGEAVFYCNGYLLHKAYPNQTYAYMTSLQPAWHGMDLSLMFPSSRLLAKADGVRDLAFTLQRYMTNFAQYGNPNHPSAPYFPMYGANATVQNLNVPSVQAQWNDRSIKNQRNQGRTVFKTRAAGVLPDNMMSVGPITDLTANERCNWWQRAFEV